MGLLWPIKLVSWVDSDSVGLTHIPDYSKIPSRSNRSYKASSTFFTLIISIVFSTLSDAYESQIEFEVSEKAYLLLVCVFGVACL